MKKAMALLGVTLVSGLILTTAQEIKAQETSENIIALRSRRSGSRSSVEVAEVDPSLVLAQAKDIILMAIQEKGTNLIVGLVRVTSQVVIMTVTMDLVKLMVLVARIVRIQTLTLVPNQVAVRAIQKASLLLVTVLASQNRIQIQATQSLRCLPLS